MQVYIDLGYKLLTFESSQNIRIPNIGEDIVYDKLRYNVIHITTYYSNKDSYAVYVGTKLINDNL